MKFLTIFDDFVHTLFPENCTSCNTILVAGEEIICTNCRLSLPQTKHFLEKENDLYLRMNGCINFKYAASFLIYNKHSRVQNILKAIKYHGNSEVANYFGKWIAKELIFSGFLSKFDLIIPVPLHPSRQKIRGYNQAEELAKPIGELLDIPIGSHIVSRTKSTVSQTKLIKEMRFDNVQNIFTTNYENDIKEKNILLIDDVITTGSTIESLAKEIQKFEPKSLSLITLADANVKN